MARPPPSPTLDSRALTARLLAGLAVLGAVLVGGRIGSGDFSTVKAVLFLLLGGAHVLFLLDRTWALGFAICVFDLWLVGFGFRISSTEASVVVAAGFAALVCWRKNLLLAPGLCESAAFRALRILLTLFLGYLAGHLLFNHLKPFRPGDYELRNFARTVVSTGGPFLVLWLLVRFPRGSPGHDTFPRLLGVWLFAALVFNIGAGLHLLVAGVTLTLGEAAVPTSFVIPFLDAAPNLFVLRRIAVTAVLLGAGFSGTLWLRRQPGGVRLLFWSLVPLGLLGALLSGGRAVPLVAVAVLVGVHALRGRFLPAILAAVSLALLTATLNTFPGSLRHMPEPVQRSLALLVLTDRVEARSSIDSSSAWRWEVFQRSAGEWLSDRRIFWFGRGSYPWTAADERLLLQDGYGGAMDSSIRRGATHNLLTDLLLVHGLAGAILYFATLLALERFLARCRRELAGDELGHTLATLCWVQVVVFTGLGLVAGTFLPTEVSWMTGLLVGRLYRVKNTAPAPDSARSR